MRVTRIQKLSNPFFQPKGYKIQLPVRRHTCNKIHLISTASVPDLKESKNDKSKKKEIKEIEEVTYIDVDEDKIQIIIR